MVAALMKNNIRQYKYLFTLPWILFYLIYPTWALPVSVNARASVFFGLIVFFFISFHMMNRWFYAIPVNNPLIIPPKNILLHIKNNSFFFIICCFAGILHIYPLFFPILIIGDEALHLTSGLWIYEHISRNWHALFQITFWVLIGLFLIVCRKKSTAESIFVRFKLILGARTGNLSIFIPLILITMFFVAYFLLLRNINYFPGFIRYPHLIKLLYHTVYSAFGITHIGPRILQLFFYILGAVYLYRTIMLFSNRESALIGASIYLFFPVVFAYAHLAEVGCGTVFFIILISFHFLRFIKEGDSRDLLLTSFFIGTGFMYKRTIFVMIFICTIYLIARSIMRRDLNYINHLKVIAISLVPIMPWMLIGKFFSWRNYRIIWSNFRPFDGKVFSFFLHMPLDISWLLFVLFLFSVVFIMIFKRNTLTLYFGLLFIAYYFFLALDIANYSTRLAMTYYPAIAVYLSVLLCSIIDRIRWRHSFKIIYLVLAVYLVSICTVPSLNARFLSSVEFRKLEYFPSDVAMNWVKEYIKEGEKILTLRIMSADFYRVKYGIDKNKIIDFWYQIDEVSTPDKLKAFCREQNISYIMFPYNAAYIESTRPSQNIFEYLKTNSGREFEEIAKYSLDKNYIYIIKL
jgi:hypothetical protein